MNILPCCVRCNLHILRQVKPNLLCQRSKQRFSLKADTVLVSKSDDIYMNLALEDWIYQNVDLTNYSALLMWKNKPAVVIGRHQNPFTECDVWKLGQSSVKLARRNSGGGAVYHDEGNLNLSFLMHRKRYNRHSNLELVIKAIKSRWDVDLRINSREDILLDGFYKVSGTASKLGRLKTYHHFTLLIDVDKNELFSYLYSPFAMVGVKCRATPSLKARVKNLSESIQGVDYHSLVHLIGKKFLRGNENNIKYIDPADMTDSEFPGLLDIYREIKDWNWIYARTPTFSLQRTFSKNFGGEYHDVSVNIKVEKGTIDSVEIETNFAEAFRKLKPLIDKYLLHKRLCYEELIKYLFDMLDILKDLDKGEYFVNLWALQCIAETLCVDFKKVCNEF